MRSDKLITGLVFVLIGAAFLLSNFGYVNIHWWNILRLWPIFLLIAGINLVLANNHSTWATTLKALVVVGGFALILFADTGRYHIWPRNYNFKYENRDDDDDDDDKSNRQGIVKIEGSSQYNEPFTADTRIAKLNITGGGTSYILSDTTSQLFSAATKEFNGRYEFTNTKTDSVAELEFRMRDRRGRHGKFEWDSDKENSATLKLNAAPLWDIHLKTGAAKVDFDLSKFKIRQLEISGGAASFDVKLGEPVAGSTNVEISTGVSEININVPKNAACQIIMDSGLSSTSINGFNKTGDNRYQTEGFATAKNKIYIKMKGGISDFNVNRY